MARLTLTGKTIKLQQGVSDSRAHQVLLDLFGEALSQLPQLQAVLLVEAYGAGKPSGSRWKTLAAKSTAPRFQWIVGDDH